MVSSKKNKILWSNKGKYGGLSKKLFLLFFAFVLCFVLIMEVAVRYNFNSGFRAYVNDRQQERLMNWTNSLEEIYKAHNSWSPLILDENMWWKLLVLNKEIKPRHPTLKPIEQNHSPGKIIHDINRNNIDPPYIALLSADKKELIAGFLPKEEQQLWKPLKKDEQIIGWIVTQNLDTDTDLFTDIDNRFVQTQITNMLWITVFGSALAVFFGYWVSKFILTPIKSLVKATHSIAEGDYASVKIDKEIKRNDELGELAADFEKMAKILAGNEQFRKSMMADISHELRTPVTIIKGEIQAMLDGIRKPTTNNLEALLDDVDNLNRLINDVYDLALSEANGWKYNFTQFNISRTIENVFTSFEHRFLKKNLSFYFNSDNNDIQIWGDEQRIAQLVRNLLENSFRYTDPGGKVVLKLYDSKNEVKISIKDSTPGVPDALLPNLFTRFYRVEASRNKAYGGSGLGLALCKGIVEKHHGFIEAEKSEWDGLCLHVILPKFINKK